MKQKAERLCRRENAETPDAASPELVSIWKAAEMMSQQFDVIEVLANEALTSLPLKSVSEPYKLFDKCVRIYRSLGPIAIDAPVWYRPTINVCDKTFPIVPSVLIENALRYTESRTPVSVVMSKISPRACEIRVSNVCQLESPLTDQVFSKGYRGKSDKDGSGNGLYVAQLVARQHGGGIRVESTRLAGSQARVSFVLNLPTRDDPHP